MEWLTEKWCLTVALVISPLFVGFAVFGDLGRGAAAWMSAFTIVFLARYLWDLKSRPWFWVVLGLIIAGHVYVLLSISIPPPKGRLTPFGVLLPIFLVHFFVLRGVFWVMEWIMEPSSPPSSLTPPPPDPPSSTSGTPSAP